MKSILSATALKTVLDNKNLILIDATSGPHARQTYLDDHIRHAQFVDLDKELSVLDDPKQGGRHPLPSPAFFSETLARLGVTDHSHLVVYDRANGINAAARFWWMAKAAGITSVQVLEGGFAAAVQAGIPRNTGEEPSAERQDYHVASWQLPTVNMEQVKELTGDVQSLIIDVREESRYQGHAEPIDLIAGHIPSAVNVPLQHNLTVDGKFKTPEELRNLYAPILNGVDPKKIVFHCGSGVSACHSLLALDYAGFELPSLYVGSWSEWSRNQLPIVSDHNDQAT